MGARCLPSIDQISPNFSTSPATKHPQYGPALPAMSVVHDHALTTQHLRNLRRLMTEGPARKACMELGLLRDCFESQRRPCKLRGDGKSRPNPDQRGPTISIPVHSVIQRSPSLFFRTSRAVRSLMSPGPESRAEGETDGGGRYSPSRPCNMV